MSGIRLHTNTRTSDVHDIQIALDPYDFTEVAAGGLTEFTPGSRDRSVDVSMIAEYEADRPLMALVQSDGSVVAVSVLLNRRALQDLKNSGKTSFRSDGIAVAILLSSSGDL